MYAVAVSSGNKSLLNFLLLLEVVVVVRPWWRITFVSSFNQQ